MPGKSMQPVGDGPYAVLRHTRGNGCFRAVHNPGGITPAYAGKRECVIPLSEVDQPVAVDPVTGKVETNPYEEKAW